jgi:mannan endo-1,6-alpha-mannosidase
LDEVACEDDNKCDSDMRFFKGLLSINLARTAVVAPFTASSILPLLQSSAKAAAANACTFSNGTCAFSWASSGKSGTADSTSDLGSDFSALEIIQANLVGSAKAIVTQNGSATENSSSSGSAGGAAPKASGTRSIVLGMLSWVGIAGLLFTAQLIL